MRNINNICFEELSVRETVTINGGCALDYVYELWAGVKSDFRKALGQGIVL